MGNRKRSPVTEIHVDTGALSRLMADSAMALALAKRAHHMDWLVVIPWSTFLELFATALGDWFVRNAKGILRLREQLGERLRVGHDVNAIFQLEIQRRLVSTPLLSPEDEIKLFGVLRDIALVEDSERLANFEVSVTINNWKNERESNSAMYRQISREWITQQEWTFLEVAELFKHYEPQHIPESMYEKMASQILGRPSFPVSKIMHETRRYRCVRCWLALVSLVMLGDCIPSAMLSQHPMGRWLKSSRNDYYDAAIAAASAYGSVLVTQDNGLSERCRFLHNRGFIGFSAMPWEALLHLSGAKSVLRPS